MDKFDVGQVVKSKAGRDKGKCFIVIELAEDYVFLVDGSIRRMESPKKKKLKHIQPTTTICKNIQDNIENGYKITNADIRKELDNYYFKNESLNNE